MNDKELLDLYSDYLISAFGPTTGTGLSQLLDGTISHDRIQRFLSQNAFTGADLWQIVKPHERAIQAEDGVMIVDDRIAEKPYTDENDIICWHYDHAQDRQVKGINFLSALTWHLPDPGAVPGRLGRGAITCYQRKFRTARVITSAVFPAAWAVDMRLHNIRRHPQRFLRRQLPRQRRCLEFWCEIMRA